MEPLSNKPTQSFTPPALQPNCSHWGAEPATVGQRTGSPSSVGLARRPHPELRRWQGRGDQDWAQSAHSPRPRRPEALSRAPRSRRPEGPGVQPRAPRAQAPLAHPRPGLWPRIHRRALTPVPLSHTTTFLPWLSIVRPEESRRRRRTTYSPCRPALSSSSSFFAAPPSAQLSSPNRKSQPNPTRHLRYSLHGRGGEMGGRRPKLAVVRSNKRRRSVEAPPTTPVSASAPAQP